MFINNRWRTNRIRIQIRYDGYGTEDPDPYKKFTDPEQCIKQTVGSGSDKIEKNDPDPDRYQSEKQDPDLDPKGLDPQHQVKLGRLKAILGQYGLG